MKFTKEYNVLVIAGQWNRSIFSSDWVKKYLLPDEDLQVEYPMDVDGFYRISTPEMRIYTWENKLFFTICKHEDSVFYKVRDIALKITDLLPHTPVSAFGINYIFEAPLKGKLEEVFKLADEPEFITQKFPYQTLCIKRSFQVNNHTLNMSLSKVEKTCRMEFNYHYPIENLDDFRERFENELFMKLKADTLLLIKELYGLTL